MAASVARALYDEVGRAAMALGLPLEEPPPPPGRRLPLETLVRRLAELAHRSGDPDIALRIGRQLGPAAVGIPGYLAMVGPTLLDALPRVMRYQRLVADGVRLEAILDGDQVRFHTRHDGIVPNRLLSDLLVGATRFFGAWLLGSPPPLTAVWFHYPPPAHTTTHRVIFGATPRFGAGDDGFALARAWFEQPLRTAEVSLVPVLEAQASCLLAGLGDDTLVGRVAAAISDALTAGRPASIAAVAMRLHTSPRSLQRRLAAHGTSFVRLLQQVRQTLAERYLADRRLSLLEVAALLGYQEQSSFCHAYRQWTGQPPSAARRPQQSG